MADGNPEVLPGPAVCSSITYIRQSITDLGGRTHQRIPALSLQMEYIPTWTPVTGLLLFMPKTTLALKLALLYAEAVYSLAHWISLQISYAGKEENTENILISVQTFSSASNHQQVKSFKEQKLESQPVTAEQQGNMKQESNNINVTNPTQNSNSTVSGSCLKSAFETAFADPGAHFCVLLCVWRLAHP